MKKLIALSLIALVSIGFASAWLDPPTETEKQYFRDGLRNMSVREFGGYGVALSGEDVQASVYVYKRKTLPEGNWSPTFQDAFAQDPTSWEQVYDYVLDEINQSSYQETFGYLNANNQTYWIENSTVTDSSLSGELIDPSTEQSAGSVSLSPLFWSFWTGSAEIDGTTYRLVLLKLRS